MSFTQKIVPLWLGITLLLAACESDTVGPAQMAKFSPPMVETTADPWQRAELIAASVPNSRFVVGHGDAMLPLYAHGTVLVLQKLAWNHLQPGMTVVFGANPYSPFAVVCQILEERTPAGTWTARALSDTEASPVQVTQDNYIGTVVAAVRRGDGSQPQALPGNLARTPDAYCLLRCHIGGAIHPQVVPPLAPAPGSVARNGEVSFVAVEKLLARIWPGTRS